jgi:hypothetical protein
METEVMQVSSFNQEGIRAFRKWLGSLKSDPKSPVPKDLLRAPEMLGPCDIDGEAPDLKGVDTRIEVGRRLQLLLDGQDPIAVYKDEGFWSWLALHAMDTILPLTNSGRRPGELARYIPDDRFNRRYRHLLRGPWDLVRRFPPPDDDALVEPLLCNAPHQPGELYEQIASRMDQVASKGVLGAIRSLYFDEETKRIKKGALGMGKGSTRRFGKVLNQLLRTYNVLDASPDGVTSVFPKKEFSRFLDA